MRITYVVLAKRHDGDLSDEGDAFWYGAQAVNLAHGHLFTDPFRGGPVADHPPVTPLLLTPAAWLTNDSVFGMRLWMAGVGTVAVVAITFLGAAVAGRRAGTIAGVLAALHAGLWVNDGLLMSEAAVAVVVAVTLLVAVRWGPALTPKRVAVLGALCGLGILTRAELGLLLPLLVLPLVVRLRGIDRGARLRLAALAVAATVAVVAPWTLWNLTRFEKPVLVSTNDGLTLVGANCDTTYYTPAIGFWSLQCALDLPQQGDQSEVSAAYRRIGFDYIRDNLGRTPKVLVARFGRVWSLYESREMVYLNGGEGREGWASWLAVYGYWALLPVAAAGAVVAHRRRLALLPLAVPFVLVTITALLFYGIVRFRVPAEVSLIVLAAVAIDALLDRVRPRPRPGRDHEPSYG